LSPDELAALGAVEMAAQVRQGKVGARELLEAHLGRIDRLDAELHAFSVVLAEQACAEADAIDARADRDDERPLLGVPVAVKDSIDVSGVPTKLGTSSQQPAAEADAVVVRRLRAAGAVVIGKTNLPELAAWPFTSSRHWGRTLNPWAPERDPGGSSGGSAAAVAAGMCAVALGDDLGGSIRVPAACTGVFGLKPQRDRISQAPHQARAHGLSVYGPLTRSVEDGAVALDVLAGASQFSPAVAGELPRQRVGVCLRAALPVRLRPEVTRAVESAAELLASLGHQVSEVRIPFHGALAPSFFARYLAGVADEFSTLRQPDKTEARTKAMARMGRLVPRWLLRWAHCVGDAQVASIRDLFTKVDVILTPNLTRLAAHGSEWFDAGMLSTLWGISAYTPYSAIWNITGNPACSVPMGLHQDGLPLSIQLVGRASEESRLLSLAREIERHKPFPSCIRESKYLLTLSLKRAEGAWPRSR
jgi:amidase